MKKQRAAYMKAYQARLRKAALTFLGDRCVRCGVADWRVLQIDHVNGGGCKERDRIGGVGIYHRVLRGQEGYQLLCANCNWIKKYENGETRGD